MKKLLSKDNGFTLVEIAISLIILGVLITPLLVLYNEYKTRENQTITYSNIQNAMYALEEFRVMTGRYPRPAPLKIARGVVGYGAEIDPALIAGLQAGECTVNGVCVERSVREVPPGSGAYVPVLVGGLPFRQLQMNEKESQDAYNSRLVYVVTENMTLPGTNINDNLGGIDVRSADGNSLIEPAGSVGFLVFSPGPNRMGALNAYGNIVDSCSTEENAERENCNPGFEDPDNGSIDAVYISSFQARTGTATFDDVIQFFSGYPDPLWKVSDQNDENIEDESPGNIGIGTDNPTTELEIDSLTDSLGVFGENGSDGILYTDLLCNENGQNCFDPAAIGSSEGLHCESGQYMVGISQGAAICKNEISIACPTWAPVFKGLDGNGSPLCMQLPRLSCAEATVTNCAASQTLPLTQDGSSHKITAGSCFERNYICSNGTWSPQNNGVGSCSASTSIGPLTDYTCAFPRVGNYKKRVTTTTCGSGGASSSVTEYFDLDGTTPIAPSDFCPCQTGTALVQDYTPNCNRLKPDFGINGYVGQIGTARVQRTYNGCSITNTKLVSEDCNCNTPANTTNIRDHSNPQCGAGQAPVLETWKEIWLWNNETCQWVYDRDEGDKECKCNLNPYVERKNTNCLDPSENENYSSNYPLAKCWLPAVTEYQVKVVSMDGSHEVANGSSETCRFETEAEYKARPPVRQEDCQPKLYSYQGPFRSTYEGPAPSNYLTVNTACRCTDDGKPAPLTCFNSGVNFLGGATPRIYDCTCQPQ